MAMCFFNTFQNLIIVQQFIIFQQLDAMLVKFFKDLNVQNAYIF